MIRSIRWLPMTLAIVTLGMTLSACSSTRFGGTGASYPQTVNSVNPVTSSTVQTQALPPIGAANGSITTANATTDTTNTGDPGLTDQTASTDGSFVSLNDVNTDTTVTPGGRDLSSPLTVTKLLGAWDVVAGADHCRLILTQTTKSGTSRYRASTPTCVIAPLARVASWQLAGTQVQLYDDSGAIVGSLLLSGNRFLGTLSGGIAVSMAG